MQNVTDFSFPTRSRYIQAAASPKDIVILLDLSGSMAGLRKEIAKHVVHSLLDTLTDNDFISVMNVSNLKNVSILFKVSIIVV